MRVIYLIDDALLIMHLFIRARVRGAHNRTVL